MQSYFQTTAFFCVLFLRVIELSFQQICYKKIYFFVQFNGTRNTLFQTKNYKSADLKKFNMCLMKSVNPAKMFVIQKSQRSISYKAMRQPKFDIFLLLDIFLGNEIYYLSTLSNLIFYIYISVIFYKYNCRCPKTFNLCTSSNLNHTKTLKFIIE